MSSAQILVNNQPFFGRVEEQKVFRMALYELCRPPEEERLPYVFLLYGAGGIGKSSLAGRYRDMALDERPFKGDVQCLWLDWEDERWLHPSLRVGREHIGAEAVFDTLHTVAVRLGWGAHFERYQEALAGRKLAEREAAAVLAVRDERDEFAPLRDASTTALAKVIRTATGIGGSGEQVAKHFLDAGIRVTGEKAAILLAKVETRLQAKLNPEQFEMFLNPHEQLALALADGLKGVAEVQPLLVVLDTYEIVDQADRWLRLVIKAAGPHLLWVIAGRHDLMRDRIFGNAYFKGYPNDFARRLVAYDMRRLAEADIRVYFAARVAERPLDNVALEAISRATHGIPLAIREAAAIWASGQPLSAIVGDTTDATPRQQIAQKMTERYLVHCVTNQRDKRALYTLALVRADQALLRALLGQNQPDFELIPYLRDLERRYASVYREEARLHDEPAAFLLEDLQTRLREEPWVENLLQQAAAVLRERVEKLEQDLFTIEERCEDEDWIKAVQDETYYLFWQDEHAAWRRLIPRFVEALAYSHELRRGLLEVAQECQNCLSKRGQKRLKVLQKGTLSAATPEDQAALLKELDKLTKRGWQAGPDEAERRTILTLQHGKHLFQRQQYDRALHLYEQVERGLPEEGEQLKEQLGEALHKLASELIWPNKQRDAIYSAKAARILAKVVQWLPKKPLAWYHLGVALSKGGKLIEAIAAHQQAIQLDPTYARPHHSLGLVYYQQGRYDEAIAAHQQAIELDPTLAYPYNGLGYVYRAQGRYDSAIAAYQQAIQLDPTFAYPYNGLGYVYRAQGRYNEAIGAYQQAIQLDPTFAHPHNGLGYVHRAQGRYNEAIAAYQQAIQLDPTDADYYHGLGNVYHAQACYDEAIAAYQQALQLDPTNALSRMSLAACYRKLGKSAKYEQLVALARQQMAQENVYNRACFEAICENVEQALALLQQAIAKGPGYRLLARRDPDFDFIRHDARFQALVGQRRDGLPN
ncbi:MAG: tetratricopeptide repeat protein [Ardenticatenaceae bacterium]